MNRLRTLPLLALLVTICVSGCNRAGDNTLAGRTSVPLDFLPALRGDYFKLDSKIVGRPYHIYVRFPEGYNGADERRYPIVYLLDGDSMFPILAANHMFLHYDDQIPEAIVVGIAYGSFAADINRRGVDFSTPRADGAESGGAEQFHRFLEQELLPTVESRYRADPQKRILYGQTRGGFMVLYSAFINPDLFWGRITGNPSFLPSMEQFFATPAPSSRNDLTLVVTSSSDDFYQAKREYALAWYDHWKAREDAPWTIAFATIHGGTHAANSTDIYRYGMRQIFQHESAAVHEAGDGASSTAAH